MTIRFSEFQKKVTKGIIVHIHTAIYNCFDFSQSKSRGLTHGPKLVYGSSIFKSQDVKPNWDLNLSKPFNTSVP